MPQDLVYFNKNTNMVLIYLTRDRTSFSSLELTQCYLDSHQCQHELSKIRVSKLHTSPGEASQISLLLYQYFSISKLQTTFNKGCHVICRLNHWLYLSAKSVLLVHTKSCVVHSSAILLHLDNCLNFNSDWVYNLAFSLIKLYLLIFMSTQPICIVL